MVPQMRKGRVGRRERRQKAWTWMYPLEDRILFDATWWGGFGNNWGTAGNWSTSPNLPGNGDITIFDNTTVSVNVNVDTSIQGLSIRNGSNVTLNIGSNAFSIGGIVVKDGSTLTVVGGSVTVAVSSFVDIDSGGISLNGATMTIGGEFAAGYSDSAFISITNGASATLTGSLAASFGSSAHVDLDIEGTAGLNGGSHPVQLNDVTVTGDGWITGDVVTYSSAANFAPGTSGNVFGQFTINGDVDATSGFTFTSHIATSGDYSSVYVAGTVYIGGSVFNTDWLGVQVGDGDFEMGAWFPTFVGYDVDGAFSQAFPVIPPQNWPGTDQSWTLDKWSVSGGKALVMQLNDYGYGGYSLAGASIARSEQVAAPSSLISEVPLNDRKFDFRE